MNKSYWSNLRLNGHLNGKNHQTTFYDFVCDENHFKKDKYQPITACEVKLNYLHIYVHSHYQKE
jgi:hypothetical protein